MWHEIWALSESAANGQGEGRKTCGKSATVSRMDRARRMKEQEKENARRQCLRADAELDTAISICSRRNIDRKCGWPASVAHCCSQLAPQN